MGINCVVLLVFFFFFGLLEAKTCYGRCDGAEEEKSCEMRRQQLCAKQTGLSLQEQSL